MDMNNNLLFAIERTFKKIRPSPVIDRGLLAPFGRSGRIFKHAIILEASTASNRQSETGWDGCIQSQTCSSSSRVFWLAGSTGMGYSLLLKPLGQGFPALNNMFEDAFAENS